jgi:hypothetical protein
VKEIENLGSISSVIELHGGASNSALLLSKGSERSRVFKFDQAVHVQALGAFESERLVENLWRMNDRWGTFLVKYLDGSMDVWELKDDMEVRGQEIETTGLKILSCKSGIILANQGLY